jgi:hypothetical protein
MALVRGVIDTAGIPQLQELSRSVTVPSVLTNPYAATSGTLLATPGANPVYGLHWIVAGWPLGAGLSARPISVFELEWLSVAVFYLTANGWGLGEQLTTRDGEGVLRFDHGQPDAVTFWLAVGWEVNFEWLVAL